MKITTTDTWGNKRSYEVVEKIPYNFFIWNIGENVGTHEYISIAQWLEPGNKDNYSINPETVKVVPVTPYEWQKLNNAAHAGIGCLRDAEKAIKSKRHGYWSDRRRKEAENTIDIFRRISE